MYMTIHRLHRLQRLPISRERAWDFFSDPNNLSTITPNWLDFTLTAPPPDTIWEGTILQYTIRPVGPIPVQWITEITHVDAPHRFVDEQRFGPYKFWHHAHHFFPIEGGVEVVDLVHYALPLGPLGTLVHKATVKNRLKRIFDYRRRALEQLFGPYTGEPKSLPNT